LSIGTHLGPHLGSQRVRKVAVSPRLNLCYNTGHEFAPEFALSFRPASDCAFDSFTGRRRNRSDGSGNRNRGNRAQGFGLDLPQLLV